VTTLVKSFQSFQKDDASKHAMDFVDELWVALFNFFVEDNTSYKLIGPNSL